MSCISTSKVDRFTSNQDQDDQHSILHYTYRQIHFARGNTSFLWYLSDSVCVYLSHTSHTVRLLGTL